MINKIKHLVTLDFSESFTSFIVPLDHMEPLHNCVLHLCLLNSPYAVRIAYMCFNSHLLFFVWIPE
jgi:hypothetical protein